jgi:arsenate reductase
MADKTYHVLFVCTGNSARSILAEALMNELGKERGFTAFSAGSHPKGQVHPWALKTLAHHHFPTEGYRSKGWDEFARPDAPHLDFVFTVCDQAAGEVCPVWPGQPMTAHWGMPDPAAVEGPDAAIEKAFLDTFITMKRRIQLMLSLPLASLDSLAIQRGIKDIGTR